MIRINLLPFRAARKKENIRRQVSIFFLSLTLVLIVTFWFNTYLSGKISDLDKKIKDTKAQVDKYNKINNEISQIKKKLEMLNKKIEVIKTLDLTRKAPVELLADMSRLIVEKQMWLVAVREKAGSIDVQGIALDNPTVAEYLSRLQSSKRYVNVRLVSISKDNSVKGMTLKRFQIQFNTAPINKESK